MGLNSMGRDGDSDWINRFMGRPSNTGYSTGVGNRFSMGENSGNMGGGYMGGNGMGNMGGNGMGNMGGNMDGNIEGPMRGYQSRRENSTPYSRPERGHTRRF